MAACSELGLTPVYWSAWGHDWEAVSAQRIADLACSQLDDGGILLLHDSARYGRRASARADRGGDRARSPSGLAAAASSSPRSARRRHHERPERILLVASPGGHLLQMLALEGRGMGSDAAGSP